MNRQQEVPRAGRVCMSAFRPWRRFGPILAGLMLATAAVHGESVYWTGAAGADDWSNPANWWAHVPGPTDNVYFEAADSGNRSVVDADMTVGQLRYLGDGVHTLDLGGGGHLQIANGPLQVGWDGPNGGADVTWTGGGSVTIGTPATPQAVSIGYNNTEGVVNAGSLTLDGVSVEANVQGGGMAVGANYSTGATEGRLILGPGSQWNAGTPTLPVSPGLTIGYHHGLAGSAVGLVDTSGGSANLHLDNLYVGNNHNGEPGALGTASGTLTLGDRTTITANTIYLARGDNATGVVNLNGGLFSANRVSLGAGATFHFNGGRLAVNDFSTFGGAGTLEQKGGTLAPGFSRTETALAGTTTVRGNYTLDAGGTLEIELFGDTPGAGYDQLRVEGGVRLASGALDLKLNYAPLPGAQFTIIDAQDPIWGQFAGLPELGTLDEMYQDSLYTFQISYCGFSMADHEVMLKLIDGDDHLAPVTIPAPGALLLGGLGVCLLHELRRCRRL